MPLQLQLEQEIELILGKQGLLRLFSTEWNQKWVPAIINFSKILTRKDIKDTLKDMEKGITSSCTYTPTHHLASNLYQGHIIMVVFIIIQEMMIKKEL